ncbi:hypothetical protein AVEN_182034-1 [Araneus ventricosus]|uniref:Uncharacterized protein n=1 Tax=Araneus ventricosus TaxID=182803 RepID=A0A4Y2LED3_ARAVE|nr:hypothetical protein AVEN_182034-1 [Araneus ventricosus]
MSTWTSRRENRLSGTFSTAGTSLSEKRHNLWEVLVDSLAVVTLLHVVYYFTDIFTANDLLLTNRIWSFTTASHHANSSTISDSDPRSPPSFLGEIRILSLSATFLRSTPAAFMGFMPGSPNGAMDIQPSTPHLSNSSTTQ